MWETTVNWPFVHFMHVFMIRIETKPGIILEMSMAVLPPIGLPQCSSVTCSIATYEIASWLHLPLRALTSCQWCTCLSWQHFSWWWLDIVTRDCSMQYEKPSWESWWEKLTPDYMDNHHSNQTPNPTQPGKYSCYIPILIGYIPAISVAYSWRSTP